MIDAIQEINFAFSYSAKRMEQFKESLSNTPHELEKRTKLRTLCETRWSARADALFTFRSSFDIVVDSLTELAHNGDDKAHAHLRNILDFGFIISLVAAEHVLQSTVQLSKLLQGETIDLVEASRGQRR